MYLAIWILSLKTEFIVLQFGNQVNFDIGAVHIEGEVSRRFIVLSQADEIILLSFEAEPQNQDLCGTRANDVKIQIWTAFPMNQNS
jgi:hypothetical protein